jgi:signal transduction histidine kinase
MTVTDLPARFAMDQRVIEIALQSLLSNALKYSAEESMIDLELRGDSLGRIQFSVRDCGIGIPEEDIPHIPHIFPLFYWEANVGDVPGTGLGLPL